MMLYLQLFVSFFKIGITSFGGMSMLPLIKSEMIAHGWMTVEQLSDIVAIAEMTPGPLGLNCATFAGFSAGGILGAIISNIAVMVPAFTLTAVAAAYFRAFSENRFLANMLTGIRPACVGMVVGVLVSLILTNYFPSSQVDFSAVIIGLVALFLLLKKNVSIPKVIILSALEGIFIYGIV